MKTLLVFTGGLVLAIIFGVAAMLIFRPNAAQAAPLLETGDTPQRTITVSGQASVIATADVAYITTGVQTKDKRADAALTENNQRVAAVYQTLNTYSIAKKDIQTIGLSLYQQEERDKDGKVVARYYIVSNTVRVAVHDLDKLGKVLDAVVKSGANRVQNIQFSVSDRAALLEQARLEAVKQGKTQAAAIAEAASAKLGEVQTISFQAMAQPVARGEMVMMAAPKDAGEVPVSGGQMQITATVQMTFALTSP